MFCKECGKELRETARYCKYCGRQTHRGLAVLKVKRFCKKAGIIFGGIMLFLFVLKQSGVIDNIQNTIAENNLRKELTAQAEVKLESYTGNSISINAGDVSGKILYYEDETYILDGAYANDAYMFYTRAGNVYRNCNNGEFEIIGTNVPDKAVFVDLLDDVVKNMEIDSYDEGMTVFKGVYLNEENIEKSFNAIQKLFNENITDIQLENTEYIVYVSEKDIRLEFVLEEGIHTITYGNDTDTNPVQIVKDTIVNQAVKLPETTCYLPEKDQELIIYSDNLFVNDDYQLKVKVYINGNAQMVDYDSISVREDGITIADAFYAIGSKADYEQAQEMIQYAEEQHQENMLYINKYITVGEEQKLYEGFEFTYETGGWFNKEMKTDYSLEDHNDVIMISELTPTLEKDEYGSYSYVYYCKGYYTYNGETIHFDGIVEPYLKYVEINVISEFDSKSIGVSNYRAVIANRSLYEYFGNDIEVLCDDDTVYMNYYEE